MDSKGYSSVAQCGCCSDSGIENGNVLGSDHVMDCVGVDGNDGMRINSLCTVAPERENAGEEETRLSSNSECSLPDFLKMEAYGLSSELESCAGHDISSVGPSETSKVTSGLELIPEAHGRCVRAIKQTEDGSTLMSSTETHIEGSEGGRAFLSKACDNQDQDVVGKEIGLTHRSIPDAVVPVDCNKQEEGKVGQDVNYSVVPVVSESVQVKGDAKPKEIESSGGALLPLRGSETDSQLASAIESPKRCESLEAIKDRSVFEIGCDGTSCIFYDGVKEETGEVLCDQNAALSDGAFCFPSCQLLPETILDIEGSSCNATENYLKVASETGGNVDIPTYASLVFPQMFCSQTKEDGSDLSNLCAYDLEGIEDTETITPNLKSLHEADLQSNIPERDEQIAKNHMVELSTRRAPDAMKGDIDMAADITSEIFNQVPLVGENACGVEVGFFIAESSPKLDFPLESEKGTIDVPNSSSTVEYLRMKDDNVRGSESTSASWTNCSETILSYSRCKGRHTNQSKKAQMKKGGLHPRKPSRQKQIDKNFERVFNCSKQKRSCFSKPARSSEWGLPSCTAQIFLQSNNLPLDEPSNQGSQKSQSNWGKSKPSSCRNGQLEESNRNNQTPGGCGLRLKVKFGKSGDLNPHSVTVSKVIDTSLSTNVNGMVGTGLEIPVLANHDKKKMQAAGIGEQLEEYKIPIEKHSDKEPLNSPVGGKLEKDYLEAHNKLAGGAADYQLSSGTVVEESWRPSEHRYIHAETSPDSEAINSVPEAIVSAGHQGDLHYTVLSIPEAGATPADAINRKKGKKKGSKRASRSLVEDGLPLIGSPSNSKQRNSQRKGEKPNSQRKGEKKEKGPFDAEVLSSPLCEKSSTCAYFMEDLGLEPGSCNDAHPSFDLQLSRTHSSKKVLGSANSKGISKSKGVPKGSKSSGTKKGKANISESSKSRRRMESGEKEEQEQQKPINRSSGKEENGGYEVGSIESPETADPLKTCGINDVMSPDVTNGEMPLGSEIEESGSADSAWVLCDDCYKWRRIPASIVGTIDESSRWICMNNLDKDFADCSIPQEMSNEEINAELGITQDEAYTYDGDVTNNEKGKGKNCKQLPGNRKACFKAIKTNQFLHRNRKAQTIDEIMVCHCKPPPDGRLGCGEECLNRMLNIECVQGTCPCGDFCSNQQFQKRKYTKLERFQSGKKGYGLRLLEDVRKGQFLIEYVGEVLDVQAYETRQKDYAAKGEKHFYFMTLNGNEVVDAGSKGNLGRFINHSCEPNCRTEKWMVNGEICVGIFSLRSIKKGEEVTFDYNYVRVFGAAAKRCYCGSLHCRGYIGGDPLNGDVVVESDSDEGSVELVMLEDNEGGDGILDATSRISNDSAEVQMPGNLAKIDGPKDHALEAPQPLETEILQPLRSTEVFEEHLAGMSVAAVQQEFSVNTSSTSVSISKLSSDSVEADKMAKQVSGEDKKMVPKSRPLLKTSRSSGSSKRDKGSHRPSVTKAQTATATKLHLQPVKSKGSEEASSSGQIETFEGKLNELLDTEGGISKRKDSTKGYLKLLLLTAASRGNANNEGIQSNRDLSMILDALLKTKSRSVLMDVINKNGLQMLHNIMKQYRRDFKKTPILRKLLKVLEYLATREILTLEHIIRRPPCLGMESFKDSILTLTEHDDKQVHQIARNFRDRWIPKPFRRPYYMDRDERLEPTGEPVNGRFLASQAPQCDHQSSRPTEPTVSVLSSRAASSETVHASEGGSEPNSVPKANDVRIRKRKSRWDQPAATKEQRTETALPQGTNETNGDQDLQEDTPPGFSSPPKQRSNNNVPPDAVIGQPQGKFLSRLPVSFGIPLSIVREFGSPSKEDSDSWSVAPGIPFQPFPPVPPVSRDEFFSKRNGTVSTSCNGTPSLNQTCWNIPGPCVNSGNSRKRGSSSDIGQRYFRQQKWNVPPWMRNGWGNQGNNVRGNTSGPEPGNVTFEKFK